jgi:feruloyl-CoA synthase
MVRSQEAPHRRIRDVKILAAEATFERNANGCVYVRSPRKLAAYPEKITERLQHWAEHAPDRTFLAQRDANGKWRKIDYRETLKRVRSLAQALLKRDLSPDRPIAILSGNSLEHALLGLAAMYIGVPYAPLAPAYSLASNDFQTLRTLASILQPGLVFVDKASTFEPALQTIAGGGMEIVALEPAETLKATSFAEMEGEEPTSLVDQAHSCVTADTIAKFLYTSGSTGQPKGVINTQRMLCSNQEMLRTVLYFLADEPPTLCDWLPWNHTFGGNHNLGIALYNGGTLYIDEGKPAAGAFEPSLRNLREIATTAYFNVPKGYEMLIPALKEDPRFCKHFFSRLNIVFYAAAGLKQSLWDELQELAVAGCGEEVLMVTGLGATESAPFALSTTREGAGAGRVGLPVPGVELKLAPVDGKLEARLRGPNITPGYWKQPSLTQAAFDEEEFFCMGDALAWADPFDPLKGLLFDGRLADDFKMASGTWVSAGPLRNRFLTHFLGVAREVVITAPDRDFVGGLVFPDMEGCRELAGTEPGTPPETVLASNPVRSVFETLLHSFAAASTGSSTRMERILLLVEPARLETQELTDKGTINLKQVLRNRADLVEELYQPSPSARVISLRNGATKT